VRLAIAAPAKSPARRLIPKRSSSKLYHKRGTQSKLETGISFDDTYPALLLAGDKPGRFWGVDNRKNLLFGIRQVYEVTGRQAVVLRRAMRCYRLSVRSRGQKRLMRRGQLYSPDFTVKLFAGVEFWMERLTALIGSVPTLR
jgi:hypothetical protein